MTGIRQAPGTKLYWSGRPYSGIVSKELVPRGIKTIISLDQNSSKALRQEENVIRQHGIRFIDNHIDPGAPDAGGKRLAQVMKSHIETPVYIHCLRGVDRCGFAIALWGMYREQFSLNVEPQYQNLPRPCQMVRHVERLTGYGVDGGISPVAKETMNRIIGCINIKNHLEQDTEITIDEAREAIKSNAILANTILKIAKKKNTLNIDKDLVEDLHDIVTEVLGGIKHFSIDINVSNDTLDKIKDYADKLSSLCDVLLHSEDYHEDERLKVILDVSKMDINDLSAVDAVRDDYDHAGGLSQGARGDSGPMGDNLSYFNFIDPDGEIYPGGTLGTNVRARKNILKALLRTGSKVCKECLHNPCDCDPCLCGDDCPVCKEEHKEDQNDIIPNVGLHDNYTGVSSYMNQSSGAPGAPNAAGPVMPAQPSLTS